MQVLDVQEDAEFLTQGVSDERVHEIMRQAMAKTQGRVKDLGSWFRVSLVGNFFFRKSGDFLLGWEWNLLVCWKVLGRWIWED